MGEPVRLRGMDTLQRWVARLPTEVIASTRRTLSTIADHAATRATLNTPILKGDLRRGIKRSPVRQDSRGELVVTVYDDVVYAMRRHEEFYNLGPVSRRQPGTVEGGVGRKYIDRVIKYHANRYTRLFAEALNKALLKKP